MAGKIILTGDVNLMRVTDPTVPFRHIAAELHSADVVFGNLECCLHLQQQSHANEGFFVDPQIGGEALQLSGIHAVGIANNVNYGWTNIASSIARLDEIGVLHTGAGPDLAAARAPASNLPQRFARRCLAAQFGLLADRSRGPGGFARHRRY